MLKADVRIRTARRIGRSDRVMAVAFVFLIPGFFLYHWFANIELISRVLGGYSNESAIFVVAWVAIWAVPFFIKGKLGQIPVSSGEFLYGIFMLYFGAIVLINWASGAPLEVTLSHTASIIQLTAVFLVFRLAPISSRGMQKVLLSTVVIMSLLVYVAAANDTLTLLLIGNDNSNVATYQSLARMFLLTIVIVTAFTPSRIKRMLHYLNATAVIFMLGARSEVAGLLVFAATLEWMFMRRKGIALLFIVLLFASVLQLVNAFLPQLSNWLPENRVLLLLEYGGLDGSAQDRKELMQFALNSIAADPIFGEYGSYYVLGSAGKYAHNILSAWVDLGILGFSLLVALLARLLINYVIAQRKLNPATPASAIAFHALGYGLLMQTLFFLMAAKNFTDLSVAAVVGITGAFRAHMKALDIRAT